MRASSHIIVGAIALGMLSVLCSCSRGVRGNRQETFPVTGQVLVDGQPAADVQITCHPVQKGDPTHPYQPRATTSPEGNFALTTYEIGDGIPKGEYTLTFRWGRVSTFRGHGEEDKLHGRYSNPKTSKFPVQVVDQPVALGTLQLSSR